MTNSFGIPTACLPLLRALAVAGALAICLLASESHAAGAAKRGPKSVPVQIRLAEEMAANQDWEEATRRWIEILYYFGPSDQEARAEFEIGAIALRRGRSDLAAAQWEKVAGRYPEGEWVERACECLKLLGKEPPPAPEAPPEPYVTAETPVDERQFLISEGDMANALYTFALRDYLKLPNLYPDSPRGAEARFRVGTCQALLGRPELAVAQWQRLVENYPDSPHARTARGGIAAWRAVLRILGDDPEKMGKTIDDGWVPFRKYDTPVNRGLSYAEDLYENGNIVYALQEYAKVLCDIYSPKGGTNPHRPYARYRVGVCAYQLGEPDAAARQWRRVIEDYPGSDAADNARRALAAVSSTDPFSSEGGRAAPGLPSELPSALQKRFHLAGQLVDCELPLVAIKEYLKVIHVLTAGEPNPFQAQAAYRLGLCQHLRGRPDLAAAAWTRTAEDYPNTEWAEKARSAITQATQREAVLAAGRAEAER